MGQSVREVGLNLFRVVGWQRGVRSERWMLCLAVEMDTLQHLSN